MISTRHSDLGKGLFGSHVVLEDIAKSFSECYSTQLSLGQNTVVTRIGKGFGYCSVVLCIEADWIGAIIPNEVPKQFIVKIPAYLDVIDKEDNEEEETPEEIERGKNEWDEWIAKSANREITFYQWSKKYKWKQSIPQMFTCMNFNTENITKAFIAMEYCPGAKSVCRFDYLSLGEIEQVMHGFAHLASGFESLTEEDQDFCNAHDDCRTKDDTLRSLKRVRESGVSSELMDKLEAILPDLISRKDEIFQDANSGITPVIVHSDPWSSNILMTGDGFGKRTFAKIIDYLYFHLCNPVEDLIQVITTCVEFEVRKKHKTRILRAYYDELERIVKVMPFTWEQLQYSYDKLFVYIAARIVWLYHTDQCGNDPWKLQRTNEKLEGIVEEILKYYSDFLAEK